MYKPETFKYSHREVCERTAKWVKNNMSMGLVFVEHKTTRSAEIPDVLGVRAGAVPTTFLFEVKVDRSDFTQDKNKPHRNGTVAGLGDYRFYVAPQGMIKVNELPKGWGLLEYTKGGRFLKTHVPPDVGCMLSPTNYINSLKYNMRIALESKGSSKEYRSYHLKAAKRDRENLKFAFLDKNINSELDLMYGAMRQYVLANTKGITIDPQVIFNRPFANIPQNEIRCKG